MYYLGGFLIGVGINIIATQYRKDKASQVWRIATNGTGEADSSR